MAKAVMTAEAPPAVVPKVCASSGSSGSGARSAAALAKEASDRTTTARLLNARGRRASGPRWYLIPSG
jgi:hypothetical protein